MRIEELMTVTLYDLFAEIPLDYTWLLRQNEDARGAYFANLCPKGDVPRTTLSIRSDGSHEVVNHPPARPYFPTFGNTPEEALQKALKAHRDAQTKH